MRSGTELSQLHRIFLPTIRFTFDLFIENSNLPPDDFYRKLIRCYISVKLLASIG